VCLTILLQPSPARAQSPASLQATQSQRIQEMMGNLVISNSNLQAQVQFDQGQIADLTKQVADLKKQMIDPKKTENKKRK
jgi:hypothetical protein